MLCLKIALDLLIAEQKGSDVPPKTKLSQTEFYSQLAFGVVDKIFTLQKPWKQLNNVRKSIIIKVL
jgi:hypothetical protein